MHYMTSTKIPIQEINVVKRSTNNVGRILKCYKYTDRNEDE